MLSLSLWHAEDSLLTKIVVRLGPVGIAQLDTKSRTVEKLVPALCLLVRGVVTRGKGFGIDQTTQGIPGQVGSVRVEFSPSIICHEVDLGLIDQSGDLDVRGCSHKLVSDRQQGVLTCNPENVPAGKSLPP